MRLNEEAKFAIDYNANHQQQVSSAPHPLHCKLQSLVQLHNGSRGEGWCCHVQEEDESNHISCQVLLPQGHDNASNLFYRDVLACSYFDWPHVYACGGLRGGEALQRCLAEVALQLIQA